MFTLDIHLLFYIIILLFEISIVNFFHKFTKLPLFIHNFVYRYLYSKFSNFQWLGFILARFFHTLIDIYILYHKGIKYVVALTGNDIHFVSIITYITLTNNTILYMFNISDNMRYYLHFYYGVYLYILCTLHVLFYMIPINPSLYYKQTFQWSILYFPITRFFGCLAFIILNCIIISTRIKKKHFETFKVFHNVFTLCFLVLTSLHKRSFFITFSILLFLYFINKFLLFINSKKIKIYPSVNIFSSTYCNLTLLYSLHQSSKNYIYMCIPSYSYFEWHPFTILKKDDQSSSLIIKQNGNFTKFILDTISYQSSIDILITGPYHSISIIQNLDNYIFVSNGVGILPYIYFFEKLYKDNPTSIAFLYKKIYIVWIIQDISVYYYLKPFLTKLKENISKLTLLKICIYLKNVDQCFIDDVFIIHIQQRIDIPSLIESIYEDIIIYGNERTIIYSCSFLNIISELHKVIYTDIKYKYPNNRTILRNELCSY